MDYTHSDANIVHAGTGHRMHQGTEPVPTQVSAADMNGIVWSLMEVLNEAGVAGAPFDADTPSTYRQLVTALDTIFPRRPQVDAKLAGRASPSRHFWSVVRGLQRDASMIFLGDSTGNGDNRWVRLFANSLATLCPLHTIVWRTWNDGTTAWNAPITLQTGSSGRTIYVDNCAVSGSNSFYAEGGRQAAIWGDRIYDMVTLNWGDNYGTALSEEVLYPEYMLAVCNARRRAPYASLVVVLQPSRTDGAGSAYSKRIVAAQLKVAQATGVGVADFYTAFKTHPNPPSLYEDDTHPNPTGSALCNVTYQATIAEPADLTGVAPICFNPLDMLRPVNFVANPRFSDWSGAAPAAWTPNNCTLSKDISITEGSLYSLRATNTGNNPSITQDLSSHMPLLRGKTVFLQVRVRRPAGLDALAGRAGLSSTDGATSAFSTSFNRGEVSAGGWEDAFTILRIPQSHTSLTLQIYTGAANGADNGKFINLDCVLVSFGVIPGSVAPDAGKFVTELFADSNAGLLPGVTGTFSCTGGVMTISGASPLAEGYVNFAGLTPGETYRVSGTVTGQTGGTSGGIYVRNGPNGGSSTIDTIAWTLGNAFSFTFQAPNGQVSLRIYGSTGTTGLVASGWTVKPVTALRDGPRKLRLFDCRKTDGSNLPLAAAAGVFGLSNTPGGSTVLVTETANSNSKSGVTVFQLVLPPDYIPGRDISLTVNAECTGAGNLGATKTLACQAWKVSAAGVHGSNIGPATPATIAKPQANYTLVISGTGQMPGDTIQVQLTGSFQESGGSPLTFQINSLTVG